MSAPATIKLNHSTGFATPVQDGPALVRYPFAASQTPDKYARIIERELKVLASTFDSTRRIATRTGYTNSLFPSLDLTATWTANEVTRYYGGSVGSAYATAPDGTATVSQIIETVVNGPHNIISANVTIVAGAAQVVDVWLKSDGSRPKGKVVLYNGADSLAASYNLTTGTVSGVAAGSAAFTTSPVITAKSDSWYRLRFCGTINGGSTTVQLSIELSTDGSTYSYAGSTSASLGIWNPQVIAGTSIQVPCIPTTAATRTISSPDVDGIANSTEDLPDDFAYLVSETDPAPLSIAGLCAYSRLYARIPANQIIPSSLLFNRPVMHDIVSGTSYAVSFDNGVTSHVFSSRKTVTSFAAPDIPVNSDPANGSTPGSLGHVQISITLDNSAQTFYADDSDATIWAALSSAVSGNPATYASSAYYPILRNAGRMVIGNATISTKILALSSANASTVVNVGSGRELGVGIAGVELLTIDTDLSLAASIRSVSATGHGGVAGDRVVFWNGNKIVAIGSVITAAANTFTVRLDEIPGKDFTATTCGFSTDAAVCYVNGPKVCTVRRTQNFYLPGVTTGITTYADIPNQTVYTDPVSWLGRIIAVPTGYACIEVSALTQWMGPILMDEVVEIQMADAIDTITP